MPGGNVRDETVKEILARFNENLIYKLLKEFCGEGVVRYAQFLYAITGSRYALFDRKWSSLCELCLYICQQAIPSIIKGNPGLKCVKSYFPFNESQLDNIELNIPPQNAELVESLTADVDAIWKLNTWKTCRNSIEESWEPLVKDPSFEKWARERRAS
ncbi:MAG TPA: hypothetical protein VEG44_00135 [Candidatus Acidoferrales bacterium]|nr:hypothetical protein [Candidatus Acidoferrales bacterium]